MALSAAMVWEVRTTGAATNGGGYKAGASGTDYSQQDAAQLSVTDAACTGNTTVTSATGGFTSAMIGNVMYLSSGPGWYEITAHTDTNTVTIDRNGPNATGMTANVGGAISSLANLASIFVTSNKAFIKSGTYTTTATLTFSASQAVVTNSVMPNRLIGYKTTRGDIGQTAPGTFSNNASRPVIQLSTNTGLTGIVASNGGWIIENIAVDCASLGTSRGITLSGNPSMIRNCKVSNFTELGIQLSAAGQGAFDTELTGGTSAATYGILMDNNSQAVVRCYVHDNACTGIITGSSGGGQISWNLVTNNTGASSDGIKVSVNNRMVIAHNTVYGSGRDGIRIAARWWGAYEVRANVLASNGGYGINESDGSGSPAGAWWDGNAFHGNTSGTRNNLDSTSDINAIDPYTNVLDVVITDGSPFTNAAGGDFTLNNTASRGALLRGTAIPGAMPAVAQVGYLDFGCFQHQDAGGATPYVIGS